MKMNHRELQRQLDRISASRLSKLNEGIPLHVALGQRHSITLRNKFARMGLKGDYVDACLKMVDEIGMQKVLENQPLSSRFATIPHSKPKPNVWNPKSD
jgi:hypothetical protein